jgi:hypothetical protein
MCPTSCSDCCKSMGKCCSFVQTKCGERMMLVLNLIAIAAQIVCIVYRFVYHLIGTSTAKFFYYLLSAYLIIFEILFLMSLLKIRKIRHFFVFLNGYMGKGMFIVFTTLLILETKTALEICLGIVMFVIAALNIIIGFASCC